MSFPLALVVRNPPANAGDIRDSVRSLGREDPPGGGHGRPRQYPCGESSGQRSLARSCP